jgi:hypothetical protein
MLCFFGGLIALLLIFIVLALILFMIFGGLKKVQKSQTPLVLNMDHINVAAKEQQQKPSS